MESSSPTSPDCVIFILWNTVTVNDDLERSRYFTITTYTHKDRRWSIYENPCFNGGVFEGAAYACGVFYCALVNDNSELALGTFNVALREWEVMDDSTCLELNYGPVYLVNSGSKDLLLASFHEYDEQTYDYHCCHIYRFDLSQKEWTRFASLGNRVLIISESVRSSHLCPAAGVTSEYANLILHSSRKKINKFCARKGDEKEWEWILYAKKNT